MNHLLCYKIHKSSIEEVEERAMSNFLDKLLIRVMEKQDLDFIVNIDTKVLGETRRDYWVAKIVKQAESRPHDASLVAEIDEKVIGFILGEVSG